MAMLEVNHLSSQFGGLRAVDGFHIHIEKGQLYGLIGPNGAGKTTVFNLLTRILHGGPRMDKVGGHRAEFDDHRGLRSGGRHRLLGAVCRGHGAARGDRPGFYRHAWRSD